MKTQRRMTSLFLVSMMLQAVIADSSITCFQDNLKCEMMNGNLIEMIVGTTWEECSLLCEDEVACMTFNFFGPQSNFNPHNACLLFSECESKVPSQDCLLGTRETGCKCTSFQHCPCSIEYTGMVDADNFVDIASEVQSEEACKNLCSSTTDCTVFTYYDSLDPYQPEVCLLLSSSGLEKSATKCEHCKTGPATCRSGQKCQAAFLTEGNTYPHVFAQANTTASLVSAERDCFLEVRALAIGGGGRSSYGGGGSGYPEFGLLQLRADETLKLIVGESQETSSVEKDGQVLLIAAAGQDNDGYNGGDGYSGGGAGYPNSGHGQDGGSDGSDGGDYSSAKGGKGSGLDVGTLNMTRFVLTPGKGGTHYSGSFGGGGGGILVNGEKPEGNQYYGEGFGGGSYASYTGLSGCVLIEV